MAISTFSPPQNPNVGMGYRVKPRVMTNAYGDGYSQRVGDGLNTMPRTFTLTWGPISTPNAEIIVAFFEARKAVECFFYTTPRDAAAGRTARKYLCSDWEHIATQWNQDEVRATLTEVFDLGS